MGCGESEKRLRAYAAVTVTAADRAEMAHVRNSDIHTSNGVIHVIDKPMMP
jgi:uncharacterized surface protein with fasciclin (FAS1) repeats